VRSAPLTRHGGHDRSWSLRKDYFVILSPAIYSCLPFPADAQQITVYVRTSRVTPPFRSSTRPLPDTGVRAPVPLDRYPYARTPRFTLRPPTAASPEE
jgi:hypothetical protein